MKKERGCARNHLMRGGGTATFSMGSMVQHGFRPEAVTIDACSVARPGVIAFNSPKGLMGGGRRGRRTARRHGRRRSMRGGDCGCSGAPKLFGGSYKMDLTGQGMQPNQFAEVAKIPCDQQGGDALSIEMPSVAYGQRPELIASEGGNIVPLMMPEAYNRTSISGACTKTGGSRRRRSRRAKKSRKTRRHVRK